MWAITATERPTPWRPCLLGHERVRSIAVGDALVDSPPEAAQVPSELVVWLRQRLSFPMNGSASGCKEGKCVADRSFRPDCCGRVSIHATAALHPRHVFLGGQPEQPGGLFRVRDRNRSFAGRPQGATRIETKFSDARSKVGRGLIRYSVKTWSLGRTERYGSEHHDESRVGAVSPRTAERVRGHSRSSRPGVWRSVIRQRPTASRSTG